jgi:EAL domain-containing protein (putative c-di-GMP-specific phosphodiesterase class I)
VQIGAATATVSASIGYATGTPETTTVDHMLHDADVALYAAKAQGKNMAVAHRPGLAEEFLDGRALAEDLYAAFSSGDGLEVLYQPIYTLDEPHRIVAVEALCRWTHPELGAMLPETFIASAEKSGRACELDRFVRRRAMAEIAEADTGHLVELHVNLSGSTLADPDLLRVMLEDAATTDFNLGRLVLEITEAVAIVESDELVETLSRLRELGTKIAIDDFGTGQASLSSLRWIPVDMLKIDRTFVHGSDGAHLSDEALVESVLRLGDSMDLSVVAEGIETRKQLATLVAAGCRFGQGFLLGRPCGIQEVTELIRTKTDQPPVAV